MSTPTPTHEPSGDASELSEQASALTKAKRHLRRGVIGLVLGMAAIIALQVYAPETDYQHTFFACVPIGLITMLFVFYQFQRSAMALGHPWRVPFVLLVVAGVVASQVRIKSISGEMIPQLAWRWSQEAVPELATPTVDSVESDDELPTTPIYWGQFLGNDRNGAVEKRGFEIPQSSDEVETLWNIGIGEGWASFAIAGDIAVTLEQRDQQECVTAYQLSTGELLWLVDHEAYHYHPLGQGGPRSTPTIVEQRVYAQGATGQVWCIDLLTGDVVWEKSLLDIAGWDQTESEVPIPWGRSGSPLLVDGLCVLPLGGPESMTDRALVALNADSGEVVWQAGQQQLSYASAQLLTLEGQPQIVSVNEATISGHAVSSGELLWETDWYGQTSTGANCAAVIPAGKSRFLIGKGYGGGSALIEIQQTEEGWFAEDIWRSGRVLKTKFNHSVVNDGIAYGLSNGALQAVEIDSGDRLWEQPRRGRFGQGQVILAGDTLIVQAEDGEVALVEATPDEYHEWIRIPALQHKTWNAPSLAGNLLLVRNGKQAIALKLPPKGKTP